MRIEKEIPLHRHILRCLLVPLVILTAAGVPATARQGSPGSLDPTFGSGGVIGVNAARRSVLAATPAGGFVLASAEVDAAHDTDWVVRRFRSDGTPRRSFGDAGRVRIPVPGPGEDANDVREIRLDADGRIVLAGHLYDQPVSSTMVVRLLPDGHRDRSFGIRGVVRIDIAPSESEYVAGMVVQPSGRIVVGGTYGAGPMPRDQAVYLVGLTPAGDVDLTFGDEGVTRTAMGTRSSIRDLTMTPTGRVLAAGQIRRGDQVAVARWRIDVSLDRSFGDLGVVRTTVGSSFQATAVASAPDGGVLVGVGRRPEADPGPALLRLRSDGAVDTSYGAGGVADLRGELFGDVRALVVQPDGSAIAVHESSAPTDDILLTRVGSGGTLDTIFGVDGVVAIDIEDDDEASSATLDASGRLLVTGMRRAGRPSARGIVLRVLT